MRLGGLRPGISSTTGSTSSLLFTSVHLKAYADVLCVRHQGRRSNKVRSCFGFFVQCPKDCAHNTSSLLNILLMSCFVMLCSTIEGKRVGFDGQFTDGLIVGEADTWVFAL